MRSFLVFIAIVICLFIVSTHGEREVVETKKVHIGAEKALKREIDVMKRKESDRSNKLQRKLMENPHYQQLLMDFREGRRDLSDYEVAEMFEDLQDLLPPQYLQ